MGGWGRRHGFNTPSGDLMAVAVMGVVVMAAVVIAAVTMAAGHHGGRHGGGCHGGGCHGGGRQGGSHQGGGRQGGGRQGGGHHGDSHTGGGPHGDHHGDHHHGDEREFCRVWSEQLAPVIVSLVGKLRKVIRQNEWFQATGSEKAKKLSFQHFILHIFCYNARRDPCEVSIASYGSPDFFENYVRVLTSVPVL